MRVLIAPLNWGLGHATRCIPLVRHYLREGAEVWLGGTGQSLRLLHAYFPTLTTIELAPLDVRYSKGSSQIAAMLRLVPQVLRFAHLNRKKVEQVLSTVSFDLIIADNCFGVWSNQCKCVYMTHQLHIRLPLKWYWLESLASKCHACFYRRYQEIWVPDYAGESNLSGVLGHPKHLDTRTKYIGPLSRFADIKDVDNPQPAINYDVVALLSGPEPQRTRFEQQIITRYTAQPDKVLIIRGKTDEPIVEIKRQNVTLVSHFDDKKLIKQLRETNLIISRSGYSTIMDLHVLGLLDKAELIPTPGQSEQEYLALKINSTDHLLAYYSPESRL